MRSPHPYTEVRGLPTLSDLHPDQLDVPEQRPPADQTDAQSASTSAPNDQPKAASKEVRPTQGTPPTDFDHKLFELLRPEDRLEAYKYHRDTQPIPGLSPQEERDYRASASRRNHRYKFATFVAIPAMGLGSSVVTTILMHAYHVPAPWAIGAGAGAAVSAPALIYPIARKKVEASRNKKQAKLSAAAETKPDHSSPAGG